MLIEYDSTSVKWFLPEWVTDDRHERSKRIYYNQYHAWAGQLERMDYWNQVFENIFKLKYAKESCEHPQGSWIRFEFTSTGKKLQKDIAKTKDKLERLLKRYKETR